MPGSRVGRTVALTALCALVACQVVAGIERVEKGAPSSGDGGPPPVLDPCAHVVPPTEPAADDDRDGVVEPFWLAFRTAAFHRETGDLAGIDQDGVCTCDRRADTAFGGQSTCTPRVAASDCDSDGGVDNRAGELFSRLGSVVGVDSGAFLGDEQIESGRRTLLLNVSLWNGKPNDKDVEIGLVMSGGISDPSGCGSPDVGDAVYPPQWCGKDRWTRAEKQTVFTTGRVLPALRGKGFVRDGVLTYRQTGSTSFFMGRVTVAINASTIVAKLEKSDRGLWRMSGTMASRVVASELLGAIGQLPTGDGGAREPLCRGALFPLVKSTICDAVDIYASTTFDRTPGSCDAISQGISFVAEEADVGDEVAVAAPDEQCAPSKVDAGVYACPE